MGNRSNLIGGCQQQDKLIGTHVQGNDAMRNGRSQWRRESRSNHRHDTHQAPKHAIVHPHVDLRQYGKNHALPPRSASSRRKHCASRACGSSRPGTDDTKAGLLTCGSLAPIPAFPNIRPVAEGEGLAAYSCGHSAGFSPASLFTAPEGAAPLHEIAATRRRKPLSSGSAMAKRAPSLEPAGR